MGVLTQEQKDGFWRDGCLVVPNAVSPDLLARLRAEIAGWVEQSRAHTKPFGPPCVDGRPRFDMGKFACSRACGPAPGLASEHPDAGLPKTGTARGDS